MEVCFHEEEVEDIVVVEGLIEVEECHEGSEEEVELLLKLRHEGDCSIIVHWVDWFVLFIRIRGSPSIYPFIASAILKKY